MGDILVDLLGDVTVRTTGGERAIPSRQQRLTLSLLALSPDRPVSVETIIRVLWDDDPPPSARTTVRGYVRRLRSLLAVGARFDVIASHPGGYRLCVDPEDVDVGRFRAGRARAAATDDPAAEAVLLDSCLALWRGRPLAGLEGVSWVERTVAALDEELLQAAERRCDLLLAGRDHGAVAARVQGLLVQHPFRESLWRRLLQSLHQGGRTAEALLRYETLRRQLNEALGVEPSAETQGLHRLMLRADGSGTTVRPRRDHTPA
ncbi:AfsR/SARP family transcriptional regulator [Actinoplanes sp. RD1]|uniref:AfsR/SARP family transcriptional regulator n=1 Tax=Actinoplanes sp. RD1 TaxID=3064538 RepID=UPI002741C67F|nr:BTAD domain-containing putative transcriptional regulator [Actinoplanes sp. RD1]